jgi:hypothetical protein
MVRWCDNRQSYQPLGMAEVPAMSETATYGPYSEAVMRIIAFLESGRLLRGCTKTLLSANVYVIPSLAGVKQYREPSRPEADDEDPLRNLPPAPPSWSDILVTDTADFYAHYAEIIGDGFGLYLEQMDLLRRRVYGIIEPQLVVRLPVYEIEEIAGHFGLIMDFVSVYGEARDDFPHRLYEVYLNGGYPCGWRGWFPNGQLVVYCESEFPSLQASKQN